MPEGWKPGDPIPGMPALTAAQVAAAAAAEKASLEKPPMPKQAVVEKEKPEEALEPKLSEDLGPPPQESTFHKPMPAAFSFALNPDMDIVFGATESESESDDDDSD